MPWDKGASALVPLAPPFSFVQLARAAVDTVVSRSVSLHPAASEKDGHTTGSITVGSTRDTAHHQRAEMHILTREKRTHTPLLRGFNYPTILSYG
ncbi:hypothetical protein GWI33_004762 [Rhynchophorus ferrugineus]|uniref:Uncharacterized protein n=1 Tax=Rhynchophorus ferrugineus TaxID=354439 RepID=A0A834IL88_RHYFE|nr:hypothetical protein GWI33_004762 [Rhynchophorus ferrugineus]